jgi:hypothetical protein
MLVDIGNGFGVSSQHGAIGESLDVLLIRCQGGYGVMQALMLSP